MHRYQFEKELRDFAKNAPKLAESTCRKKMGAILTKYELLIRRHTKEYESERDKFESYARALKVMKTGKIKAFGHECKGWIIISEINEITFGEKFVTIQMKDGRTRKLGEGFDYLKLIFEEYTSEYL